MRCEYYKIMPDVIFLIVPGVILLLLYVNIAYVMSGVTPRRKNKNKNYSSDHGQYKYRENFLQLRVLSLGN